MLKKTHVKENEHREKQFEQVEVSCGHHRAASLCSLLRFYVNLAWEGAARLVCGGCHSGGPRKALLAPLLGNPWQERGWCIEEGVLVERKRTEKRKRGCVKRDAGHLPVQTTGDRTDPGHSASIPRQAQETVSSLRIRWGEGERRPGNTRRTLHLRNHQAASLDPLCLGNRDKVLRALCTLGESSEALS